MLFDAALTRTSTSPKASRSPPAAATAKGRLRSNANILRAVIDLTICGDEGTHRWPPGSRGRELEREPDARERLRLFMRLHRGICEREAALFAQLEAAAGADPEAAQMLADHDRRRYETQSRLARALRRDGRWLVEQLAAALLQPARPASQDSAWPARRVRATRRPRSA